MRPVQSYESSSEAGTCTCRATNSTASPCSCPVPGNPAVLRIELQQNGEAQSHRACRTRAPARPSATSSARPARPDPTEYGPRSPFVLAEPHPPQPYGLGLTHTGAAPQDHCRLRLVTAFLPAPRIANGLPLGGVIARRDILDSIPGKFISTFGGNPLACTAALATLDYVLDHDLQRNAETTGQSLLTELRRLGATHPHLTNPRGQGLMLAIDIVDSHTGQPDPDAARAHVEACRARQHPANRPAADRHRGGNRGSNPDPRRGRATQRHRIRPRLTPAASSSSPRKDIHVRHRRMGRLHPQPEPGAHDASSHDRHHGPPRP
ncbi:aminotransferase class III-fold pyridoxal phosphate-dependent enzyme [Streptomyces sp. NPDC058475]|uniref:aminotransferase class III-fold pyridoxal phosphate-dependent enzyme n=1 Tax=Streptomyces sp. NPDC058475 TaxID=3346518 RepID=UPI0036485BEB